MTELKRWSVIDLVIKKELIGTSTSKKAMNFYKVGKCQMKIETLVDEESCDIETEQARDLMFYAVMVIKIFIFKS